MDFLPVLASGEHYNICRPWFEDREITKWLTSPLRLGRYPRMLHDKLASDRKNRVFFIMIHSSAVGIGGLLSIDRIDRRAEVWYLVGDDRNRRKGYASEALRSLTGYAVESLELNSLYAHVSVLNGASVRVLEKCGYRYAGRLRQAFHVDGLYQDALLYDWISDVRR